MNLINTSINTDLSPIITVPLNSLARMVGVPGSTLIEMFTLAQSYDSWAAEYDNVINGVSERVSPDSLQAIARMKLLLSTVSAGVSKAFYTGQDPNILALSELMADLSDAMNQLTIRAPLAGVEIGADGAPIPAVVSYHVSQGDTLESIAMKRLGSTEAWVNIARFNDLDLDSVGATTPLNTWVGRILQLPTAGTAVKALRDPAVLDAPIGLRALGTNFPITLVSRSRNDVAAPNNVEFNILTATNALLESLQTRLETAVGTLPDYPEYGSYIPSLLGQDHGPMSDRLMATHVESVLRSDPRVQDVLSTFVDKKDSAISIYFQVRLFNGLTVDDLWLGYTVTRT